MPPGGNHISGAVSTGHLALVPFPRVRSIGVHEYEQSIREAGTRTLSPRRLSVLNGAVAFSMVGGDCASCRAPTRFARSLFGNTLRPSSGANLYLREGISLLSNILSSRRRANSRQPELYRAHRPPMWFHRLANCVMPHPLIIRLLWYMSFATTFPRYPILHPRLSKDSPAPRTVAKTCFSLYHDTISAA